MKKRFNNKKAQLGSTLTLMLAIIAIFVLFVIFMWAIDKLNSAKGLFAKRDVSVKMTDSFNSLYSLQSYISSSVEIEIDGKKEVMTISDLIRLWNIYNDVTYKNALQSETEKILKLFIKKETVNVYCYYIEIENYITKTESFKSSRGKISESLMPIQLGDRNLARLNERATLEIPLFGDKTATANLIINSLCLKS